MAVTAKVKNTRTLDRKLRRLVAVSSPAQKRVALQAGIQPILNRVRQAKAAGGYTPVLTGTLRRSYFGRIVEVAGGVVAIIGTNLEYAARVEFGFVGADSLGRIFNQSAQPHLRPSFDEKVDEAVAEIADVLVEQLRSAT